MTFHSSFTDVGQPPFDAGRGESPTTGAGPSPRPGRHRHESSGPAGARASQHPLQTPSPPAAAEGLPSPTPPPTRGPIERTPRVLLAEDNRDLQHVLARQLTMLGVEVVGVRNGRDAVDLGLGAHEAKNPFDLILMDLEMPVLDGYEATRLLREGGVGGPILALTAHSNDEYRAECLKLGCEDCLCKPIDVRRLADLLRRYVPWIRLTGM